MELEQNSFVQNLYDFTILDNNVVQLLPSITEIPNQNELSTLEYCVDTEKTSTSDQAPAETDALCTLLKEWDLEALYEHFRIEHITIEILKIIKVHHIERLLKTFNMGTQILFESKLERWRDSIGCPLQGNDVFRQSNFCRNDSPATTLTSPASSPRSSPYPRCSSPPSITLCEILNDTKKGRQLCEYYNEHSEFREEKRVLLINTIAQYCDDRDLNVSLGATYRLEQEIVDRFPTEKNEYYRTSKRGRLYNKLSNIKATAKTLAKTMKHCGTQLESNSSEEPFVPEDDAATIKRSLMHDKLSIEEFDHLWKACVRLRLKDIAESENTNKIFEKWPQYKKPQGFRLIDMDYRFKYKDYPSILDAWEDVKNAALDFLLMEGVANNKIIKLELDNISNLKENSYDSTILWALHGYLVPFQRVVLKDGNKKMAVKRFTVADSQESFIISCASVEEMEDRLKFEKSKGQHIQPFILTIGNGLKDIKDIFVYFDDLKIPTRSVIRAVDICFQIYFLFNLEYPKASQTFWNFIQTFFYNIPSKTKFAKVNILVNALQKTKEA